MTLPDSFLVLRRRHVMLEVAALASVLLALGLGMRSGADYDAQAQVLLTQSQVFPPDDQGILIQQKLNLLVLNYSRVVSTPEFASDAVERAGLDQNAAEDLEITGSAFQNASIVKIEVAGKSRSNVLEVTEALQSNLISELAEAQSGIDESQRVGTRVLEVPAPSRASANLFFTVFAALVVGLTLAATIALLLESE